MSRRVGVRELKDHLSDVLRSVKAGETVEITERDKPVAILLPFHDSDLKLLLARLADNGALAWGGGHPRGLVDAPKPSGATVSDAVIEDRR